MIPPAVRIPKVGLALAVLLAASTASAKRGDLTFGLKFTPTIATGSDAPSLTEKALAQTIQFRVTEGRHQPDLTVIGQGTDDDDSVFAVKTTDEVIAFARQALTQLAAGWGLRLEPSSQVVLEVAVTKWFISEENQAVGASYTAEVNLRGELRDGAGSVLWRGIGAGDARRYGKKQRPENYNEVSSDAAQEALAKLLSDTAFQDALEGKPQAAAAEDAKGPETPDQLLTEVKALAEKNFSADFLASYVSERTIEPTMTTDDLVKWKEAGIPEPVIKAAYEKSRKE